MFVPARQNKLIEQYVEDRKSKLLYVIEEPEAFQLVSTL